MLRQHLRALARSRGGGVNQLGKRACSTEKGSSPRQSVGYYATFTFLSSLTVGVTGLGLWQTKRYFEKVDIIEERHQLLNRTAEDASLESLRDARGSFVPMTLRGTFDHNHEVYLGSRSAPKHTAVSVHSTAVKTGFYVVTPLVLQDGTRVLVNRGWVPSDALPHLNGRGTKFQRSEAFERPEGEVVLRGVAKEGEAPTQFALDPEPERRRFYWLDLPAMAAATGCVGDVIVDGTSGRSTDEVPRNVSMADVDAEARPLPRPLSSYMDFYVTPRTHITYAATWFSLAVAGVFLTRHWAARQRAASFYRQHMAAKQARLNKAARS